MIRSHSNRKIYLKNLDFPSQPDFFPLGLAHSVLAQLWPTHLLTPPQPLMCGATRMSSSSTSCSPVCRSPAPAPTLAHTRSVCNRCTSFSHLASRPSTSASPPCRRRHPVAAGAIYSLVHSGEEQDRALEFSLSLLVCLSSVLKPSSHVTFLLSSPYFHFVLNSSSLLYSLVGTRGVPWAPTSTPSSCIRTGELLLPRHLHPNSSFASLIPFS